MARFILLLALTGVACVEATPQAECPATSSVTPASSIVAPAATSRPVQPEAPASTPSPREFVPAPRFESTELLIQWLDAQGKGDAGPLLVRAPMRFVLKAGKYPADGALLGEVSVSVDDSLLPEALSTQLSGRCEQRPQCTLSVVGFWRRRIDAPLRLTLTAVGAVYHEPLPGSVQLEIASMANSDDCANALVDRVSLSEVYGERHPKMLALDARLAACPKPIATRPMQCRGESARLQELRSVGKGPAHPDVVAARKRVEACEAALPGDGE
ncbi:MAG: hypothetical protein AB7K71_00900 [Polyangiaceae bacterium]